MGEAKRRALALKGERLGIETFAGKVHVEWDPQAAVTPLGQLPFFIEFLKVSGLFDHLVSSCPLNYTSPNAPDKRDIVGTLMLSVLAGHWRYSHISSIRCDTVNPELLGMKKAISEDAARRALSSMEEEAGVQWLESAISHCTMPLLKALPYPSWILDLDLTVKCLYGKQEGAVVGYNPHKRGRPSHGYHSYFMANTRLALNVEVKPGNETPAKHTLIGLWPLLESIPKENWPAFIRGDSNFGVEPLLVECEERGVHYLSKLRLTAKVKKLIVSLFYKDAWREAGQGWEGMESMLQLSGWTRARRVIVLRREIKNDVMLTNKDLNEQLELAFIETSTPCKRYEYAVLVTSLPDEILSIAQHYRDRGDMENNFDELKNQWGWAGFTTHDLKRCRFMARFIALIYNWWNLFVRLAQPHKHFEAMTSRPLLLQAVAKQIKHAGQTFITITSSHAKQLKIQRVLTALTQFLAQLKANAEQLTYFERLSLILMHAFRRLLNPKAPDSTPLIFETG